MSEENFDVVTCNEGKTGGGQLIEFSCRPEDVEKVKKFLETIEVIDIPTTKKVCVGHGGYGRDTRFNIIQRKYAGGGCGAGGGYIEILEIKNPPDGRCGFIVHQYIACKGSIFIEFDNIKNAIAVWNDYSVWAGDLKKLSRYKGFIRLVKCGGLSPWFYAVGDQHLLDDFVFPDVITEDPIYRFGRKFIVRDYNGLTVIKTCMGMHFIKREIAYNKTKKYRVVYWDDGTIWDEYNTGGQTIRPLDQKELWIQDAVDKFHELLSGKSSKFTINFIDGSKFIGRLKLKDSKSHSAEGRYNVQITLKGGRIIKGEFDFAPTPEIPTVEDNLHKQAKDKGKEIKSIDSVVRILRGNKKWAGVYSVPS